MEVQVVPLGWEMCSFAGESHVLQHSRLIDMAKIVRSGPSGSSYFDHSWMFSAYIPDVLVGGKSTSFETSQLTIADH